MSPFVDLLNSSLHATPFTILLLVSMMMMDDD